MAEEGNIETHVFVLLCYKSMFHIFGSLFYRSRFHNVYIFGSLCYRSMFHNVGIFDSLCYRSMFHCFDKSVCKMFSFIKDSMV